MLTDDGRCARRAEMRSDAVGEELKCYDLEEKNEELDEELRSDGAEEWREDEEQRARPRWNAEAAARPLVATLSRGVAATNLSSILTALDER